MGSKLPRTCICSSPELSISASNSPVSSICDALVSAPAGYSDGAQHLHSLHALTPSSPRSRAAPDNGCTLRVNPARCSAAGQERRHFRQARLLFERSLDDAPCLPPFSHLARACSPKACVERLRSAGFTASVSAFDGDRNRGSRRVRTNAPREVLVEFGLAQESVEEPN